MKHFLHALGRRALTLAVAVGFCSGVWAEAKYYYFYPDGTPMPTEQKNENRIVYYFDAATYTIVNAYCIYGETANTYTDITEITIPDRIDNAEVHVLEKIEYVANLHTVNMPKFLEKLDANAFDNGSTVKKVVFNINEKYAGIANKNCNIADNAFAGCTNLLNDSDAEIVYTVSKYGVTYSICPKTHAMKVSGNIYGVAERVVNGTLRLNNEISGANCQLNGAYKNNTSISSLVVTDGVATLGDGEFSGCTNLQYLVLPKSFDTAKNPNSCGDNVFDGCNNLKNVYVFNGGVPYTVSWPKDNEGYYATSIDCETANADCSDEFVKNNINRAPKDAEGDIHLFPIFEFANGYNAYLSAIDDYAFLENANITSVTIEGGNAYGDIRKYGVSAFQGCTNMKTFAFAENCPQREVTFGKGCFKGCTALANADFSKRFISKNADYLQLPEEFLLGCSALTTLGFGNEIDEKSIGKDALSTQISRKLCVVKFVKSFGSGFTVNFTWANDHNKNSDDPRFELDDATYQGEKGTGRTFYGVALKKLTDSDFHTGQITIPEQVSFYKDGGIYGDMDMLCDDCFAGTKCCKEITLPKTVFHIGYNCFNTASLEKLSAMGGDVVLTRPEGVADSKEMAATVSGGATQSSDWTLDIASNYSNIKYFVTKLADGYLKDSQNLRTFTVRYNAAPTAFAQTLAVGADALSGCTALTKISLGSAVTEIGANAFSGCTAMKSLVMNWVNLKSAGDGAFGNCDNLKTVVCDYNTIAAKTSGDAYDKIIDTVTHGGLFAGYKIYAVYSKGSSLSETNAGSNYSQFLRAFDYRYLPFINTYSSYQPIAAGYATVCLPMAIMLDNCYNIKGVYKAQLNADGTAVNLVAQTAKDIQAGVPYIFARNDNGTDVADDSNLVVFAVGDGLSYISQPQTSDDNILTGTFAKESAEDGDYVLQSDNKFHIVETSSYAPVVGAYRSYIKASSLAVSVSPAALLSLNLGGSATGIGGINAGANAADTKVYTIDGQRVYAPVKGQVYIIGGKKRVY